jgi:Uma2 family endonuclease
MPPVVVSHQKKIWTDEELEALPRNGCKHELLDGEIIMSPVHANHGIICMRIGILLGAFVQRHKLGEVFDSSTGFRLADDLLLSPDLAFVSRRTLRRIMVAPDKFLQGAPDLVVEVLSPSDRLVQIHRKLDYYFEHGTRLAWLVNWKKQQVYIHAADSIEALTRPNELLTAGDVVPGFQCKLAQIFRST